MGKFERHKRSHRLGHDHAQRDADGKLEVSVEREQDHENQYESEGADQRELRSGLQKLAILSAPGKLVTLGESYRFVHRRLSILHSAGEVAAFDTVLHSDVAGIVFPVNEGCTISLGDVGQL